MKPVYKFLQSYAFWLCAFFGTSPFMPTFLQRKVSLGSAEVYCWTLSIASLIIFGLCCWWMKSDWQLDRPAYMTALSFGSLLGSMVGIPALFGMFGSRFWGTIYTLWVGLPSQILIGLMLVAFLAQVPLDRKVREIRKG